MWWKFKKWIISFFKKEETCAYCNRRLFDSMGQTKIYPMLRDGKTENVHRRCLYQYLFKHAKNYDYLYKLLTK